MALSRKPIEIVDEGNHQLLIKADHWVRVPLSDVAVVQNGFAFKSELFTHAEGKPLIRIRDIEDGWTENFYSGEYSDEFVVRKGDILIGMDGDFNAAIWQGVDGLLNQRVCRLIPSTKDFSEKFLFLCLQPYLNAINAETSSVTVKHLSSRTIGEIPLPLPPLNEQHRIVAKIEELFSELDKGIENLKTAQAQLKVYRQALLKHAFEGKLTAQWRAEHQDKLETAAALQAHIQQERAQRYQQQLADWEASGKQGSKPKAPKPLSPLTTEELAELPELPVGWGYVRAEEIAGFITKGTTPSKEFLFDGSGEIPFIKVYNLTKTGFLDFSIDPTFVSVDTHNGFLARSKVYPGDVLMNIVGPPLGKVSIVPNTYPEWNINQAIAIFRSTIISNKFLAAYLAHETTVRAMMKKSKATAGQFNLTLEICRETLIPLCSKEEQKEMELLIEAKLSEVDQLDQTITASLQQAEALRQSILKKAFSGQLVPQDPHDEPASVLLDRIRAEKESVVAPKWNRRGA